MISKYKDKQILNGILAVLTPIVTVFIIITFLVWLADAEIYDSVVAFFKSSLGGRKYAYLMSTISKSAIITGMAISALISFRAGLFNIGGEGQLVVGGLTSAVIGLEMAGFGSFGILVALFSGMFVGAIWGIISGILKLWCGVPILVGSLLLNYPAKFLASYFVSHPFRDVASGMPQSHLLSRDLWLPLVSGTRLDIGFIIILLVFFLTLMYCHLTSMGYKAKMVGLSPDFAISSGLPEKRITLQTLAISGAVAGLVGGIVVLGIQHRFTDGMLIQPLYAWTGIIAALLVNLTPWAIIPAAFFFSAIYTGASGMERIADVPKEIAIIVQGVIILFVASNSKFLTTKNSTSRQEEH